KLRAAAARGRASYANPGGQDGKERRPLTAYQCSRLTVLGFSHSQVLVRHIQLGYQRIELRISIKPAPGTPFQGVAGRGGLPTFGLTKVRRRFHFRTLIIRADGAACQQGNNDKQGAQGKCVHNTRFSFRGSGKGKFHNSRSSAASLRAPRRRLKRWRRRSKNR